MRDFAGLVLWGSATVSLILATVKSSLIWVAAPLLGFALSYSLLRIVLYRPPEVHLGVVYRLGRFSRWVGPEDWEVIIPWIDEVKQPISLHLRRAQVSFSNLLTQNQVPVDCECCVYYRLDLRHARADFRAQALYIPDKGWTSIVRTVLRETAGEVIGSTAFQHLLTARGRQYVKHALSELLATRVRGLGLVVSPETGVSVQELKPTETVLRAIVDQFTAEALGEAARLRVRPMLEDLNQGWPGAAWDALLLEWAAAVAKDGDVPHALIPTGRQPAPEGDAHNMQPAAIRSALQSEEEQSLDRKQSTDAPGRNGVGEREAKTAPMGAG